MDELDEMRELIKAQEKERLDRISRASERTGLDRRAGKDRRKNKAPYDGPERRTVGRRGRIDRRTGGPNKGYEDEKKD